MADVSRERALMIKDYVDEYGIEGACTAFDLTSETIYRYIRTANKTEDGKPAPKIVTLDIETLPIIGSFFRVWNVNIRPQEIIHDWALLSMSYKWMHEADVRNVIMTKEEAVLREEARIVEEAWNVVNDADVIITYNGEKFDAKRLNAKFVEYGFPAPSPYKHIDIYRTVGKQFDNTYKSLDWILKLLGLGMKLPHQGRELWTGCQKGDVEALKTMKEYNDNDTVVTELLYLHIRSWIVNHPNIGLYTSEDEPVCHKCGSSNIAETDKKMYTAASAFDLYQCNDCSSYSRFVKRSNTTPLRPA